MPEQKQQYLRIDLAARQLETAVWMFLEGKDRFSVITLAGAATGILTQLVINAGKQPFADFGRLIVKEHLGKLPTRTKYTRHVNLMLGIDLLKHHAPNDALTIELDEEKAAESAVTRAMIDYVELRGDDFPFVRAFFNWLWINRNGPELVTQFNSLPRRLKKLRKKNGDRHET
jgi:hypothetical protein